MTLIGKIDYLTNFNNQTIACLRKMIYVCRNFNLNKMNMKLTLETAKKLYNDKTTQDWFKKELETEFGKQLLKVFDYRTIKTFEDACEHLGLDPKKEVSVDDDKHIKAYKKLIIIYKAVNNGWTPDWTNSNVYKYYPWFEVVSSGSGLSYSYCNVTYSITFVGSRLCTDKSEKAEFVGNQFKELYEDYLLLK